MTMSLPAGADFSYAEAVTVLANALDRLGARIHRDLHVESSYVDLTEGPQLANTLIGFSAYADECLAALDDPSVTAALAAARIGRTHPA